MARISKLLRLATAHLEPDESALAAVRGLYDTKILGTDSAREGVFVATERLVLFYAKKMGGFDLESFAYRNISSFEQSKSPMGHKITFFASGNKVSMKWINDKEAKQFTHVVKSCMSGQHSASAADSKALLATDPKDEVFAQLHKLGSLRDAGIVSEDEFNAKKAELLARL